LGLTRRRCSEFASDEQVRFKPNHGLSRFRANYGRDVGNALHAELRLGRKTPAGGAGVFAETSKGEKLVRPDTG